jgi:hypothetical protein
MIGIAALLLFGLASSTLDGPGRAEPPTATPIAHCRDVLAQMHRKPPHVTLVGCRLMTEAQGKPLRATYKVDGEHAAAVEAYLVRAIGLSRLRRSCCQWDAPPRSFVDKQGRGFTLTMTSQDTAVTSRARWNQIRQFQITVETMTEEI